MSLLEQFGWRLRATADGLPLDAVEVAAERLKAATELLIWVRSSSTNPMGVPSLANATEHLEQASYALRVGQDTIAEYLASIGVGNQSSARPSTAPGTAPPVAERQPDEVAETEAPRLGQWWEGRINYLSEHDDDRATDDDGKPADRGGASRPPAADDGGAGDSEELLRQTARRVRSDDRDGLRGDLARVRAPVGLGMSALTPSLLRTLATELLGHEPRPDDLPRLRSATSGRVRGLMPRIPDHVVEAQLARVCRAKPATSSDESTHPTDSAVTGALLTGVLLQRLGRDPDSLREIQRAASRRPADDPNPPATGTAGSPPGAGTSADSRPPGAPDGTGDRSRSPAGSSPATGSPAGVRPTGGRPTGSPWRTGPSGGHG